MTTLWHRLVVTERLILASLLLAITLALTHMNSLWRWNQAIYDAFMTFSSRPASDDIAIIAIDARSLSELGNWPWPRQIHAQMVRDLSQAGVRAIVFDVVFAETSTNPEEDQLFAAAIKNSGRVILSMLGEQPSPGNSMIETLPIPPFLTAAAATGHVHYELDQDGITRSQYLQAGLGTPAWPSLGLATLRFLEPARWQHLPGQRDPDRTQAAPDVWARDFHILIPFTGPPGSYQSLSYSQILLNPGQAQQLRGKIVLIGSTVTGLNDTLPTPVSGFSRAMAGVEIHANVIDSLRAGLVLQALSRQEQTLLSVLLLLIPVLSLPSLAPRYALLGSTLFILAVAGLSFALFHCLRIWFPPLPVITSLSLSYPLWNWRRLEYTLRYLDTQLKRLNQATSNLKIVSPPDAPTALNSIQNLLPVDGWVLNDASGRTLAQSGTTSIKEPSNPIQHKWQYDRNTLWAAVHFQGQKRHLGLSWAQATPPSTEAYTFLKQFSDCIDERQSQKRELGSTIEFVHRRVELVQAAATQLRAMRQLNEDSLEHMSDGVLITNLLGQVLLTNRRVPTYLGLNPKHSLIGESLESRILALEGINSHNWHQALSDALLNDAHCTLYARGQDGRDLMIQLARLALGHDGQSGVIINLTDISQLKASERERSELLGFLSHDLRSPMVSILSLIEVAEPDANLAHAELLERITSYTRQVLTLSEGFLYLAQADSAEASTFYRVDLIDIAYNAIQQVWPLAKQKRITLEQRFTVTEAPLSGDGQLLERALVNLLGNAIKYSPDGQPVTVSIDIANTEIHCTIQDSGYGISESFLPHIFERFSREKRSDTPTIQGTGLGLAFVHKVVQRHGGHIKVTSTKGKGSCFCLIFPLLKQEEEAVL